MEEIMEWNLHHILHDPDDVRRKILTMFVNAHRDAFSATGNRDHALSVVRLEPRHIEVLGKMQRFRDQGEAICRLADQLRLLDHRQIAEGYYQRARNLAEAHGFFSVECESCLGLGKLAMETRRDEEGVELMRNALACVPLCEVEDTNLELDVLHFFAHALFDTDAIDEAEPIVARYREAAMADFDKKGLPNFEVLHSLYTSARLHEVLCTFAPDWDPLHNALPLHLTEAESVSHRYHHARTTTHARVEPHTLDRNAGGLKRPRGRCAICSTSCAGTTQK
jgi:hypothetical protein